jgi:glutaredoxin-like YruB-family protein
MQLALSLRKTAMTITEVRSHNQMLESIKGYERAFVLLYKEGSENSMCALESLKNAKMPENVNAKVLAVNVAEVRDIHGNYDIKSAPSLMRFENGRFKNEIKGCHDPQYYGSLLENALFTSSSGAEGKAKRVTVYSTPSCPHCKTLKTHLRRNGISFRDINVASDQQKAQELVKRTGQQGVPQTEINGQWVLGFDKAKINRLLEIEG